MFIEEMEKRKSKPEVEKDSDKLCTAERQFTARVYGMQYALFSLLSLKRKVRFISNKIFSGDQPRQNSTAVQRFRGPLCLHTQVMMPILTRLVAREDCIAFSRRESLKSYRGL
jgi:hypothetical protein